MVMSNVMTYRTFPGHAAAGKMLPGDPDRRQNERNWMALSKVTDALAQQILVSPITAVRLSDR